MVWSDSVITRLFKLCRRCIHVLVGNDPGTVFMCSSSARLFCVKWIPHGILLINARQVENEVELNLFDSLKLVGFGGWWISWILLSFSRHYAEKGSCMWLYEQLMVSTMFSQQIVFFKACFSWQLREALISAAASPSRFAIHLAERKNNEHCKCGSWSRATKYINLLQPFELVSRRSLYSFKVAVLIFVYL